eukprot:365534-Chlamydomonas_euryale.AAC.2
MRAAVLGASAARCHGGRAGCTACTRGKGRGGHKEARRRGAALFQTLPGQRRPPAMRAARRTSADLNRWKGRFSSSVHWRTGRLHAGSPTHEQRPCVSGPHL